MTKPIYILQLPKQEQEEITLKLKAKLQADGYSEFEVFRALKDAMDSKIADVLQVFDEK